MHPLLPAFLIAIFLSQTVGFGWPVSWPAVEEGDLSTLPPRIEKFFNVSRLPAVFSSASDSKAYGSLVMVGDVLLARNVEYLMRSKGGDYPFAGVELKSFGEDAAVVGNFEASIPIEHTPTPIGMIDFSVPTSSVPHLSDAGFTHMSLANNHSFDFEDGGLQQTSKVLSEHLTPFGDPKEVTASTFEIVTVDNKQVALIGIHGLIPVDDNDLKHLFKRLNKKSDFQLVYVHWGEEYALQENDHQRDAAKHLISLGADLIVGHHPHVVQGIDLIEGVPVFYSLGNYVFDQYFSKDVQEGLVVSVDLEDGLDIGLIPVTSKATLSQPNLMAEEYHADWLKSLSRKSHPDLQVGIESGRIDLTEEIATSLKVAIMHGTEAYVE